MVFLVFVLVSYMVTNVSVQYNGGLLMDIVMLNLCDYNCNLGNPFNTMESSCLYS